MFPRNVFRVFGLLAFLLLLVPAAASAAPAVSGEFSVPGLTNNDKIVEGPEGNIWLATGGIAGKDVARIIPPTGKVDEFNVEAVTPSGITVGPEGLIWVSTVSGWASAGWMMLPASSWRKPTRPSNGAVMVA